MEEAAGGLECRRSDSQLFYSATGALGELRKTMRTNFTALQKGVSLWFSVKPPCLCGERFSSDFTTETQRTTELHRAIRFSLRYIMLAATAFMSLLFLSATNPIAAQSSYSLRSPDQRIEVRIRLADRIRYDVLLNGIQLLQDSILSLKTSSITLGLNPRVKDAKKRSVDQRIEPVLRQKIAKLREHYNEVRQE